jgi:hypothetical protein
LRVKPAGQAAAQEQAQVAGFRVSPSSQVNGQLHEQSEGLCTIDSEQLEAQTQPQVSGLRVNGAEHTAEAGHSHAHAVEFSTLGAEQVALQVDKQSQVPGCWIVPAPHVLGHTHWHESGSCTRGAEQVVLGQLHEQSVKFTTNLG